MASTPATRNAPEDHGNETGTQTGFIAQDVQMIFPGWVGENNQGFKTLNIPSKQLAALMVEAFRTLKAENDRFKGDVETLRDQVRALANGEHPNVGGPRFNFNDLGWFIAGVLGTLFWVSRRKRAPQTA